MAEHTPAGPAELGAPMDYSEHDKTYERFLDLTKLTIIGSINIVLALVLFAFGAGSSGFWLGFLMVVLAIVTAGMALAGGTVKPAVYVALLGVVFIVLTVA